MADADQRHLPVLRLGECAAIDLCGPRIVTSGRGAVLVAHRIFSNLDVVFSGLHTNRIAMIGTNWNTRPPVPGIDCSGGTCRVLASVIDQCRSEEHTSELQS